MASEIRSTPSSPGSGLRKTRRSNMHCSELRIRLVPWFIGAISFLQNFGSNVVQTPLNRLLELSICREYYQTHDPSVIGGDGFVPENLCKERPIQTELANLFGLLNVLTFVCSLIVVIPFGYISDRYGRKLVLVVNMIGAVLAILWLMIVGYAWRTLSVKLMIAAPFFYMIGGSVVVGTANGLAIVADVSHDIQQRTRIFAYFNTVGQAIRLLSPAIGSFTMSLDLWAPFWIGVGSFLLSTPLILALPDTRTVSSGTEVPSCTRDQSDSPPSESDPLLGAESSPDIEANRNVIEPSGSRSMHQKVRLSTYQLWRDCRSMGTVISTNRNVALSLMVLFLTKVTGSTVGVMIQYISYRYHWTIAQAGYLFTIKAAVNVLLFTVLIPLGMFLLTKKLGQSKEKTNITLTQTSLLCLVIGSLLIGLAPKIPALIVGLVLYALGSGVALLIISYLTTEVYKALDEQHTAQLYSVAGLVEAIGDIVGIPVMSSTLAAGINVGGVGLGIPFFISTALSLLTSLAVWGIRAE